MISKELSEAVKQYFDIEHKICSMLEELPKWNDECNCEIDKRNILYLIEEDKVPMISEYCLNCGGYIL